jgi:hypothetical protein
VIEDPRRLLALLLVGLTACAGAAPAPRSSAPQGRAVPDAIVEDEALLDDALADAGDESRACPDRCQMAGAVCDAAERICGVVSELRDVSLAPRCDRARGSCADARARVSSCGCGASAP